MAARQNPAEQQLIANLQNQIFQLSNEGLLLSHEFEATLNRVKAVERLAAERAMVANRLRMNELQLREMESTLLSNNLETRQYVEEVRSRAAVKAEQIAILAGALSQAREACAAVLPNSSTLPQEAGCEAGPLKQRQGVQPASSFPSGCVVRGKKPRMDQPSSLTTV